MTLLLSGPLGIVILIVATAIGLSANSLHVQRNHLMGCIILPVILFSFL